VGGSCKKNNMKFVIKVLDSKSSLSKSSAFNQKSKPKKSSKELKVYHLPTTTLQAPSHVASKIPISFSQHANSDMLSKTPQTTTTTAAAKYDRKNSTKTVINKNDDIFLLEPDSIDYGDLLSQFITISSVSNDNNSEKKSKNKLLTNGNIKNQSNSDLLREYELTNSACSQSKPVFVFLLFEFLFLINLFFHKIQ
jgi:hypothetical protein